MFKILVLNAPDFKVPDGRELKQYSKMTLDDINRELNSVPGDYQILFFQGNSEVELAEKIRAVREVHLSNWSASRTFLSTLLPGRYCIWHHQWAWATSLFLGITSRIKYLIQFEKVIWTFEK